jgi:hypothetical protein
MNIYQPPAWAMPSGLALLLSVPAAVLGAGSVATDASSTPALSVLVLVLAGLLVAGVRLSRRHRPATALAEGVADFPADLDARPVTVYTLHCSECGTAVPTEDGEPQWHDRADVAGAALWIDQLGWLTNDAGRALVCPEHRSTPAPDPWSWLDSVSVAGGPTRSAHPNPAGSPGAALPAPAWPVEGGSWRKRQPGDPWWVGLVEPATVPPADPSAPVPPIWRGRPAGDDEDDGQSDQDAPATPAPAGPAPAAADVEHQGDELAELAGAELLARAVELAGELAPVVPAQRAGGAS